MKILHLIDSGGFYGAEAMLLNLMIGQKKIGLHPILYSMGTVDTGEKEIERRATLQGLAVIAPRLRAGLNPYGIVDILKTAQTNQIDILHSHGYKGNILAGLIPRSIRKIPFLCTLHGWTNVRPVSKMAIYEFLDRLLLRYKDAVVVVNKLMLADPRLQSANVDNDRIFIVNNGIDPHSGAPDKAAQSIRATLDNFTGDSFTAGAIGRLSAEKGFEFLLKSIALLHNTGQNIKLVVIGDGPLREQLHKLAVSLGINKIVLFTGYLENASQYLDCFDVLAISSQSEGLPITLLEAMRASIPVISTRVGGIPDVIANGYSGILVMPGNVQELGSAIKQLADNPAMGSALSNTALMMFRNKYTSDIMAANYLAIYKQLLR
jgi:glycosyltransferase involved in cell wall biosynthesis